MLPRTVQLRSCMASSRAKCVLKPVRLISSASRMLPKMGPCTNVQVRRPLVGSSSMISVPVMSLGIQFTPDLMPSDITGTDIIEEHPTRWCLERVPPVGWILAEQWQRHHHLAQLRPWARDHHHPVLRLPRSAARRTKK